MCLFSIFYDTKVRCFVCVNVILHRMTFFEWSFVKNRKTAETSRVPEQTLPVLHVIIVLFLRDILVNCTGGTFFPIKKSCRPEVF